MAPEILLSICIGASSNVPFHNCCAAVFQSAPQHRQSSQTSEMGFRQKSSYFFGGLCFVAVCVVRARWPGCPEWRGSRVPIVRPFIPQYVYLLVKKRQLCWCASRSGTQRRIFAICRPPASTTTANTLLRTTTAVLSYSLAYFNYQPFLMDPLSRSSAKRSKTAEVVETSAVSVNCFLKLMFASCE